jgi:hypothetical protein
MNTVITDEFLSGLTPEARAVLYDFLHASGAVRHAHEAAWVTPEKLPDDTIYRVEISPVRNNVKVIAIGMSSIDSAEFGEYDSVDALPQWMQDKLAVLMLMSPKPPTDFVEGVGRRIEMYVYWLVRGDNADDTGS